MKQKKIRKWKCEDCGAEILNFGGLCEGCRNTRIYYLLEEEKHEKNKKEEMRRFKNYLYGIDIPPESSDCDWL